MTVKNPNPGDPTPPPLNEEEMLAWVEGRLSKIDEWKLSGSIARPGVSLRARQMQANRSALCSLADEKAPPELLDRVLAALERDALLGLANGDNISDSLPISMAEVKRPSSRRSDRLAPMLALAAGVVLLIAGAAYWSTLLFKPSSGGGTIAWDTGSSQDLPLDGLAIAASTAVSEAVNEALPPMTADSVLAAAKSSDAEIAGGPIDAARALALAKEGRLAIRVRATNLRSLPQIESASTSRAQRPWRLSRDVPPAVVAAILPVPGASFVGPPPREVASVAAFAAANTARATINFLSPMIGPGAAYSAPLATTPEALARVRGTYLADVADSTSAITVMMTTLRDRLDAEVVFEELTTPVVLPERLDPETLLWWTLPPSNWAPRVTIPLVVEDR